MASLSRRSLPGERSQNAGLPAAPGSNCEVGAACRFAGTSACAAALVGTEVVSTVEIDGIDLGGGNELRDLDGLLRLLGHLLDAFHEILAPLQSLMALHARSDDPSRRYIERMQQALGAMSDQVSALDRLSRETRDESGVLVERLSGHTAAC